MGNGACLTPWGVASPGQSPYRAASFSKGLQQRMKPWPQALTEGVVTGSVASLTSAAALAGCGRVEHDSAVQPINAPGHWIWGDPALAQPDGSARYTVPGFIIHHASAVFWATLQARYLGGPPPRPVSAVLRDAGIVTALAAAVDLRVAPRRLRPGFERQLAVRSLVTVYAAFGLGLAACTCLMELRRAQRQRGKAAQPRQDGAQARLR